MITIGSQALQHHISTLPRECKDVDYIAYQSEFDMFVDTRKALIDKVMPKQWGHTVFFKSSGIIPVEFEIVEMRPSTGVLMSVFADWQPGTNHIAPLNVLYALKMSHRFRKNSPHFHKTMADIKLIRNSGCDAIADHLLEWYKMREKETYNYKHPSLNKGKKDFFVDNFYVWEHDDIHAAVALHGAPAFTFFKEDTAEVKCSKEKFFNCGDHIRLAAVYEESCVLALERHQIPNDFQPDPRKSFLMSLERVCTGITSGWFREYAWESYDKVVNLYDLTEAQYINQFHNALAAGLIRPHNFLK